MLLHSIKIYIVVFNRNQKLSVFLIVKKHNRMSSVKISYLGVVSPQLVRGEAIKICNNHCLAVSKTSTVRATMTVIPTDIFLKAV